MQIAHNKFTKTGYGFLKVILSLIIFVSFISITSQSVFSASLTNISNTLSRMKTSTLANHTFEFDLGSTTTLDASDTIVITFPGSSFTLSALSNATPTDFDVSVNGTDRMVVASGGCASNDAFEVTTITATTITLTACGSFVSTAGGATIAVEIGTNATFGGGGVNQIFNPSVASAYDIEVAAAGDTGTLTVAIISDDEVVISASVDPTLSVTISSNVCNLGSLTDVDINTCQYNVTVSTNATNGYASTIIEDGNLRTAGSDEITDVAGGTITAGTEEYGVSTSNTDGGNDIATYVSCTNPAADPQVASPITGSLQQFAAAPGPVANDATTLCHAATIAPLTPAGDYSHIVTIVVTATF